MIKIIATILAVTVLCFGVTVWFSVESFIAGQMQACNSVLMLHPDTKRLKLFCEEEHGEVFVKSAYTDFKYSVTFDD